MPTQLTPQQVKEEFARRKRTQLLVLPVLAVGALCMFALLTPDAAEGGPFRQIGIAGMVLMIGAVAFALFLCACPACGAYLRKTFNPRFCARCGAALQ